MDDAECSELCSCGESLTLTCHALCVPFAPCRTALAFYSHASPAYQAFRGRCLCYSGRFICMKPPLGDYSLPGEYSSFYISMYISLVATIAIIKYFFYSFIFEIIVEGWHCWGYNCWPYLYIFFISVLSVGLHVIPSDV